MNQISFGSTSDHNIFINRLGPSLQSSSQVSKSYESSHLAQYNIWLRSEAGGSARKCWMATWPQINQTRLHFRLGMITFNTMETRKLARTASDACDFLPGYKIYLWRWFVQENWINYDRLFRLKSACVSSTHDSRLSWQKAFLELLWKTN